MTDSQLIGIVAAVVGVGLFLFKLTRRRDRWGLNLRRTACPGCGTPFPRIRRPASFRQAMWGGWTCASCGTEVDKWGRPVSPDDTR